MEHTLFELPVKPHGLALADPVRSAAAAFAMLKEATCIMQEAVQSGAEVDMGEHMAHLRTTVRAPTQRKDDANSQLS